MTAVIAPVVPTAIHSGSHPDLRRPATGGASRKVPLAPLAVRHDRRIVYGLCSVDYHGRIADRAVFDSLGWTSGTAVGFRQHGALLLATKRDRQAAVVTASGHLHLPVGLRRWNNLTAGDRILLSADPAEGLLLIHPPAALDALIRQARKAGLAGGEDR